MRTAQGESIQLGGFCRSSIFASSSKLIGELLLGVLPDDGFNGGWGLGRHRGNSFAIRRRKLMVVCHSSSWVRK